MRARDGGDGSETGSVVSMPASPRATRITRRIIIIITKKDFHYLHSDGQQNNLVSGKRLRSKGT